MRGISKKKLIFLLVTIMLVGLSFQQNAYAQWEKEGLQWKYLDDYGYKKGWQQISGKWYYFSLEEGVMKIGWFYDEKYNKWYYLNFNGDMDTSKTTSTYPVELSNIQERIKQYSNQQAIYQWTRQLDSNIFIYFMSNSDTSHKQYYYHPSTGNIYEIKNGILTNIVTHEVVNIFTEEQAVQEVQEYLSRNYKYIPQIIKVEGNEGEYYLIHCYDDIGRYTTPSSWYRVNKTTRSVTSI